MQSGYEIRGNRIEQQHNFMEENMNQISTEFNPHQHYHILQQIHTLPAAQQLFQGQNHFQAYFQRRLNDSYCEPGQENISTYVGGGDGGSVPIFPASLKFDLNHESGRNNKESTVIINEEEDALLRGSEQYDVLEIPLKMPHCWQNQEDSVIEQRFWKPLTVAVSNEESEIADKQEQRQEMNRRNHYKYFQLEPQMNCLDRESRLNGELESIYKRIGIPGSNQTGSGSVHLPVNNLPVSDASIGEKESTKMAKKRRKKKKMKARLDSVAIFLESFVNQIMEHQENLHRKFTQVIERLDQEREEREEAWRKQELAKFEREAAVRAREKAMATSREAAIVSYLEKITGQRINLPPPLKLQPVITQNPFCTQLNSTTISASDVKGDERTNGIKHNP